MLNLHISELTHYLQMVALDNNVKNYVGILEGLSGVKHDLICEGGTACPHDDAQQVDCLFFY